MGAGVIETRLVKALKALFPVLLPERAFLCPRKYRLVRMRPSLSSSDNTRAELQIVSKATGLPDLLLIDIWPGVAGSWANLQPGTFVLVDFIDGDPGQPIARSFATADDPAWRPIDVTLDCTGTMKLGPSASTVDIASGSEVLAVPGTELGRPVRYGDTIVFPVGAAMTPTGMPVLASAPPPAAPVPAPIGPVVVSKVIV